MCDHQRVTTQSEPGTLAPHGDVAGEPFIGGESRWPPALAMLAFLALNIAIRLWLPSQGFVRLPWLVPGIEAVLLVVLVGGNPGSMVRHGIGIRRLSLGLVVVLVVAALWDTAVLIHDLIEGSGIANKPSELLATGALVWLGNNIAFAMLYWLLDGGGPVARVHNALPVDFAFTQQLSPEIAPPDWRPHFLDYLHLGFTNATAFSPTDVMPLTLRAKYVMLLQSTVALALFGLVVARAVNAFS
jgi:hypothetical protein